MCGKKRHTKTEIRSEMSDLISGRIAAGENYNLTRDKKGDPMQTVNIKTVKKCAFCKHWYDPTNSAIKPLPGNWWEFDREKEARCMKSVGLKTKGRHTCNKFELKI